jgi:hypothetical protein
MHVFVEKSQKLKSAGVQEIFWEFEELKGVQG